MFLHLAIYAICFTAGLYTGVVYPLPEVWYGLFGFVLGWKLLAYHRKKESLRLHKLMEEHTKQVESIFAKRKAS